MADSLYPTHFWQKEIMVFDSKEPILLASCLKVRSSVVKKCLKISMPLSPGDPLIQQIQKHGIKMGVEGTLSQSPHDKDVKIVVCGLKDQVDKFVDLLHKEALQRGITDINIEPFVRIKDYRGAFRIIE